MNTFTEVHVDYAYWRLLEANNAAPLEDDTLRGMAQLALLHALQPSADVECPVCCNPVREA